MTNTDMHDLVTLADPHGEGLTQSLEWEDVFTEGTIGSQPAILHTRDRASEALLNRLPVAP